MTSFARLAPFLGLLLPLAGCFEDEHTVGTDDAGNVTNDSGTTSCEGENPGCCAKFCDAVNETATCDEGKWTCPTNYFAGPACPAVCELADSGSGDANDCAGQVAPPCAAPAGGCTWEGPTCVNGHLGCGTMVCDAGGTTDGGACSGDAPSCCGWASDGCREVTSQGVCQGSAWTCPGGDFVNVCDALCMSPDAGIPVPVGVEFECGGPAQPYCDSPTQYCHVTEGGAIEPDGATPVNASCETIPAACASDTAGSASLCACIKAQTSASGNCSYSGDGVTITLQAP